MVITSAPEELASPARLGRSLPLSAQARTGELYARHAHSVGGLCRGLLRDRGEAEDAVQQVFLSAHRALLNGSAPREAAAWLATIARNECLSRIRARMREPLPTAELEAESSLPDPLAEAIRRADLAALWRAIEQLPRRQRHALLLREFGGLSYEELADALGVSRPTVESLLFRARHALRDRWKAAYAAVSGASWLDAAARFLAGGSGTAAPVAAKAVAVGVGAAVVTSGAVVAPTVVHHHRHSQAAAAPARHVFAATRPRAGAPRRAPTTRHSATSPHAQPTVPAARSGPGPHRRHRSDDTAATTTAPRSTGEGKDDGAGNTTAPVSPGASASAGSDGGHGSGDTRGSGDGSRTSGGDDGAAAAPTATPTTTSGDSGSGGGGSGDGSSVGQTSGSGGSGSSGSPSGGSGASGGPVESASGSGVSDSISGFDSGSGTGSSGSGGGSSDSGGSGSGSGDSGSASGGSGSGTGS